MPPSDSAPSIEPTAQAGSSVVIPRDLHPQDHHELGWWYYSGHLENEERQYGFQVALFRVNIEQFRAMGVLPVRWLCSQQQYFAHIALADLTAQQFSYGLRKGGGPRQAMAPDCYRVRIGNCVVQGDASSHQIDCSVNGTRLTLILHPTKPLVEHQRKLGAEQAKNHSSVHFSLTRMQVAGHLQTAGGRLPVSGSAWMDREYGQSLFQNGFGGWDWFAIQLNDGRDIMVELIRDEQRNILPGSSLTIVDIDGRPIRFFSPDFTAKSIADWKSTASGIEYPVSWEIRVPSIQLELQTQPQLLNQELDTRGISRLIYWEGASLVSGRHESIPIEGKAYVELVGYDGIPRDSSLPELIRDAWRVRQLGFDRVASGQNQ